MKKILPFLLLFTLLGIGLASSLTPETGGISYYNFSSVTDLWSANDATNDGADSSGYYPTFNVSGDSSPSSFQFVSTNTDKVSYPQDFLDGYNEGSVSLWYRFNNTGSYEVLFGAGSTAHANPSLSIRKTDAEKLQFTFRGDAGGVLEFGTCNTTLNTNKWYHIVFTGNGTETNIFLNGWEETITMNAGSNVGRWFDDLGVTYNHDYYSGAIASGGSTLFYVNGYIDEVKIYNKSLNVTEANNLYERGSINISGPLPASYFDITATNAWTTASITNFSAYFNGTWYHTTNGTINTGILSNTTPALYNITLNASGYADRNYTDYNISSDLAGLLYPANGVNITFLYEDTNSVVNNTNITIEFISSVYTLEANTSTGYYNTTLPYPVSYQIRYQASGYSTRFYTFTLTNNTYNELTLYVPATTSQNVTINVLDTLNNVIEGATVKVLKYFVSNNSYVQVASVQTNFEGKIVESMEVGTEFYQFIIEYNSETVLTTVPSYIYSTSVTLYINLIGEPFNELFSQTSLYGLITFTPNQTFTFTFDDGDNTATQGCLYAYRIGWNTETLTNTSCTASAAGTASFLVDNTSGYSYLLKGYITKGGIDYYVTNYYYTYGDSFTEDGNGVFLVAILVLVFALIAFWRIEASVIFAGLATLLISITGMVNIGITYTAGIFALSVVTAIIIYRGRGGSS